MKTSTASLVFHGCLSLGVVFFASSLVFAATANQGGTLKSVAASGKTITVTVGTGSSAKTESFGVTAGTNITLDDKPAKLSALTPGSKVSISYDKSSKDAVSITAHSKAADRPKSESPNFSGVIRTRKLSPVSGRRAVLAILWDPHRTGHSAPPAKLIDELLFGPRPSVADWFSENSGSALTIEKAGLLGWYDADKPPDHYWSTNEKTDPQDRDGDGWLNGHVEKWAEAIRKADREFDFAARDFNGDKTLQPEELAILIVIPQAGPFGTNRVPAGRQFPKSEPLIVDGVRIPMIAEVYSGLPANLGAAAHELSHLLLGAPDLYMTSHWPFAAGDFSLMDHSYTSAHLDPFLKLKLGWLKPIVVTQSGEFHLKAIEQHGEALVLFDPACGPGEYFLLENRHRTKSYDAGIGLAGRGLLADGLAVWHILEDPQLIEQAKPPTGGPGEWGRKGIRLIRANGGTPFDDSRALFSKRGATLSDTSDPARLRWIDGSPTGFQITLLSDPRPELHLQITRSK